MLYGKMEELKVAQPQATVDDYNYSTDSYTPKGKALVYLVVQDRSNYKNNDLDAYTTTLVGYTEDNRIKEGWLVDDKLVTSVIPHRFYNVLYLKENENG